MNDSAGASQALIQAYFRLHPGAAAQALGDLPLPEALRHLASGGDPASAGVFERVDPDRAVELLKDMDADLVRRLWPDMDPGVGAALLARLDPEARTSRLAALPRELAAEMEELMRYPAGSAGRLMDTAVTLFRADETAGEALDRIRSFPERRVHDLCVVDEDGRLTAMLPLQEVAVAQPGAPLAGLVRRPPVNVQAMSSREEVVELLEAHRLSSLPVVSFEGRLRGIIRHDALVEAAQQEATEDLQTMVGAGREERALSPASLAVRQRLPWLQVNLATAFLAAAVVALFEDTIARFTALAVFLPVVAGQSGNTGAQALAVAMRGLTLREFRPRSWFRVARKEVLAGLINGVAVAIPTALAAWLWSGGLGLPLVIGTAMVFSMAMAGLTGAVIPVVLTFLGKDPAQSASIVLTTVTDVLGFLSFLGLASLAASSLGLAL